MGGHAVCPFKCPGKNQCSSFSSYKLLLPHYLSLCKPIGAPMLLLACSWSALAPCMHDTCVVATSTPPAPHRSYLQPTLYHAVHARCRDRPLLVPEPCRAAVVASVWRRPPVLPLAAALLFRAHLGIWHVQVGEFEGQQALVQQLQAASRVLDGQQQGRHDTVARSFTRKRSVSLCDGCSGSSGRAMCAAAVSEGKCAGPKGRFNVPVSLVPTAAKLLCNQGMLYPCRDR